MNIKKLLRPKKCDIEVHLDKEKELGMHIFWLHDTRKKSIGAVDFGDVILDLDKRGNICGIEILNANKLNIRMETDCKECGEENSLVGHVSVDEDK